jgi:hypothetical protein
MTLDIVSKLFLDDGSMSKMMAMSDEARAMKTRGMMIRRGQERGG